MKKQFLLPVFLSSLARLTAPFLIFQYPLSAIVINFILDCSDGLLFSRAGFSQISYQLIDKALDFYWYFFILSFLFFHRPPEPLFQLFLLFFGIRLLGEILFFFLKKKKFFIFFPNVFERLFWVYILSRQFNLVWLTQTPFLPVISILILVGAITGEYLIHWRDFSLLNFLAGRPVLRWKN